MIGPCLVLLLGGAPNGALAGLNLGPVELRLRHAVVVSADAPAGVDLPDTDEPDAEAPGDEAGAAPAGDVPLRKADVLRTPAPTKEH